MERQDVRVATAIALLSAAFLFVGLGRYGVVNGDEAIYHGIAERMVETGDLLTLDFRGERRVYDTFMNAPLHYWARAGLIAVFGSSHVTMRALSALFGVLSVVATFALGRRLAGRSAGVWAAAVQLTTYQFVYLHGARTGELDTLVTFLVVATCLAFLRGVQDGRSFLPHHLLAAALLMTKLPLVALPVAAELLWLARRPGDARHLSRYLRAGLVVLPLALLWHGAQAIRLHEQVGPVLLAMLGQASGHRATDGPHLGALGNARFYAGVLLHGALPWSAAYPFAALATLRPGAAAGRRTALLWACVVLVFFCLVSKHFPWYLMPAYPFLSVLVGAWLADLSRADATARLGAGRLLPGLGMGAVAAALLWIRVDLGANPFAELALLIPMEWSSRRVLGVGATAAIAGIGALWAAFWIARGARLPDGLRRGIGWGFALGLLGYAGLRVTLPLAHLGHPSELDRIHRQLHAARRAGAPLDYPIRLGVQPPQIARFLFGEDFEIVPRPTRAGAELLLFERGDPAVLTRSIGRAGLEHRLRAKPPGEADAEATPGERQP